MGFSLTKQAVKILPLIIMTILSLLALCAFAAIAQDTKQKEEVTADQRAAIFETLADIRSAEAQLARAELMQRAAVERLQKQFAECGCSLQQDQNGRTVIVKTPKSEAKKEEKK